MAAGMAAALREASQPCQEMEQDHPESPALGEYFDVDARRPRRSTGDSGRFSWRGSFSLSSPTFKEDTASLAESMIASRGTIELCEAGRAGNEYIAVESDLRDAGIELREDDDAINASGRAAQTRRRSGGLPRKRLSASDLGVMDQDATDVEPLYDALSFPTPPHSPDTPRADTSAVGVRAHTSAVGAREPFYLAPTIIRRQLDGKASGDNGANRQTVWGHACDEPGLPPPDEQQAYEYDNRLSLSMPPTKIPKHRYSLITDLEASGDNGADRQVLGHAYDDLGLAPTDEQDAISCCCSEQAYEYDSRLPLSMPPTKTPKHRYSLITDLEASGDNDASRPVSGHAYDDLRLAPPDEQDDATSSEQTYEYDSCMSPTKPPNTKPPKHRYSLITDSGIYEHICTVTHH